MLILRLAKLLVILLVTILMGANGSSINGFVRNDLDGEPISYANVFISNTSLGAATNRDGYSVISGIPSGEYELNVSMIGYAIHKKWINLADSASIRIEVRLKSQAIKGSEVLVTA